MQEGITVIRNGKAWRTRHDEVREQAKMGLVVVEEWSEDERTQRVVVRWEKEWRECPRELSWLYQDVEHAGGYEGE